MAVKYAIISGAWSNPAIWNGGTLPQAGDDVYCNGYIVYIQQSITVAKLINGPYVPLGIVQGGFFNTDLGGDITVNADIDGYSSYVFLCNSTTGNITINGDVNCFSANLYGLYINTSVFMVVLNGNADAGTSTGNAIYVSGGSFIINGDITSGSLSGAAFGIQVLITTNTVINGNIYAVMAEGIRCGSATNPIITINGNVYGSSVNYGLRTTNYPQRIFVNGEVHSVFPVEAVYNQYSQCELFIKHIFITNSAFGSQFNISGNFKMFQVGAKITVKLEDDSLAVLSVGGEISGQLPIEADVRAGVDFALGTKTGTCAVPPKEAVGFGVPVDDTEGEAIFTADALFTEILNSNNPVAQRLKNCSTVATTSAQLNN